jgi:hypothetical protein
MLLILVQEMIRMTRKGYLEHLEKAACPCPPSTSFFLPVQGALYLHDEIKGKK